jgi:CDP-2,3-bis-(O-geranylgeranyl)-sn-glycerol synthase
MNMNNSQIFWTAMLLALPMWLANMTAVVVARLEILQIPVDRGRYHKDGRRFFGETKSFGGLLVAPLAATIVVLGMLHLTQLERWLNVTVFSTGHYDRTLLCWLIAQGALVGDLAKSYVKRRMNIPSGKPWRPWDRVDMLLGSSCLGLVFVAISQGAGARHWSALGVALPGLVLVVPPITVYGTDLVCRLGYALKIKQEAS